MSWVQCFGTYVAIVTSKKREKKRQLLAYQTLIVREARGKGWLAYDSYFRQQAVGDDKADWSRLNQSLYAVEPGRLPFSGLQVPPCVQSRKYLYMADLRAMDACRPLEASGIPDEVGMVSSLLVANEWKTVLATTRRIIKPPFGAYYIYICTRETACHRVLACSPRLTSSRVLAALAGKCLRVFL